MNDMPAAVAAVAADLAGLVGVEAVVLGGSRAIDAARPDSDWDLGLYYRGRQHDFAPSAVRDLGYHGQVAELGEWGPLVNAGAWLQVEGIAIDVLFRDLDAIDAYAQDARTGIFDIVVQPGTIVGAPTYLPLGELASCKVLYGDLEQPQGFPAPLAKSASTIWRGKAELNLLFAQGYASLSDVVGCLGMLSQAVLCEAHARMAEQYRWALNEKRLIVDVGLQQVQQIVGSPSHTAEELTETVSRVAEVLNVAVRPKT